MADTAGHVAQQGTHAAEMTVRLRGPDVRQSADVSLPRLEHDGADAWPQSRGEAREEASVTGRVTGIVNITLSGPALPVKGALKVLMVPALAKAVIAKPAGRSLASRAGDWLAYGRD